MSTLTRHARGARWATVAVLTAVAATAVTLPASAAPNPSTASVASVDSEDLTRLCRDRLPILQARAAHLIDVIQGGPEVAGSVEWLHAQADEAEANGHPDRARLLDQRADRRATHVEDITRVVEALEDAAATYCADVA